jgi:antitoxin (DNA-binding transcriptional repressor) of toxin-antitoxin stability system
MNKKKNESKPGRHEATRAARRAYKTVTVRGLRQDWRRVKDMVSRGSRVVVTDNGVPIMQLVPIERSAKVNFDWIAHLQTIREITAGKSTGGNSVLEERASYKS